MILPQAFLASNMARRAFTITVLFFLFAFSYARTPFEFPGIDAVDRDLSSSFLPEADTKQTILLPSQKPEETDPTTIVELEPIDSEPIESAEDLPESETVAIDAVPRTRKSTVVIFRPINRHFHLKRQFSFRLPLRRCSHHIKPMKPRFHGHEISYGNDMILSRENSDFHPLKFRGGEDRIPEGWVSVHSHHGADKIPEGWVSDHHHHYRRHDHGMPKFKTLFRFQGEEDREKGKAREEEREGGGFMKHFRKFLNHF